MGKRFDKRNRGGGGGGNQNSNRNSGWNNNQRSDYKEVTKINDKFENYYRSQGFIGDEEEFKTFWAALKEPLPTTWRFTGSKGHAMIVRDALLQTHIPHLTDQTFEGQPIPAPTPLPWYPDQLAWQLTVAKSIIRRSLPFKNLQAFLVSETTCGNISRQEAVSMIPPLLLDVQPHHTVLDMCAAPGSKTAQLIEAVHYGEEDRVISASIASKAGESVETHGGDDGKLGHPTGLVVANDKEYKRSHMLIHQTKRLNSPNLIVTNHDATQYPSLRIPTPPSADGRPVAQQYLRFDRVLCDVPCSGDGTIRKNPAIWNDWSSGNGIGLWPTQVRILARGLQLAKPGGRVVYSTCSMNPMENESVIQTAIERCGGLDCVELVDVSDQLPALKRNKGLTGGWRVLDKDGTWYDRWEEVLEAGAPARDRLARGMFAPTETSEKVPLERCVRVYPHMQDTGGFFIAVLHKKKEFKLRPENAPEGGDKEEVEVKAVTDLKTEELSVTEDITMPDVTELKPAPTTGEKRSLDDTETEAEAAPASPVKRVKTEAKPQEATPTDTPSGALTPVANGLAAPKPRRGGPPPEEPFKFLSPDHEVLNTIKAFYNLSPLFPLSSFLVRNNEGLPSKTIYYTSTLCRGILTENEGRSVKFVHCGVKMFNKQDVQGSEACCWRIQNEGLKLVEPWVGPEREIRLTSRETLRELLKEMFPHVGSTGELKEQLERIGMGCCVLRVELEGKKAEVKEVEGQVKVEGDVAIGLSEKLVLPLWKSNVSVNLMLPKDERQAMLLRLYNDTEGIKDTSKMRRLADAEKRKADYEAHKAAVAAGGVAITADEQEAVMTDEGEEDVGED